MLVSPINFKGSTEYLTGYGTTRKERSKDLERELKIACLARRAGVDAPNYKAVPVSEHINGVKVKYERKGAPAIFKINPITSKHLDNLFTNFYRLEEIGFCHSALFDRNVLFDENGNVQIESMKQAKCFKSYTGDFIQQNGNVAAFVMPSNADNYEAQSLCTYVSGITDEDDKLAFVKKYLENKSDYHNARANLLVKNGFHHSSKTLKFEKLQSKIFKNPSDDVVELVKDKLEILDMKKQAVILWNDGNGMFPNTAIDPNKRFNSIILMLHTLKSAMNLANMAQTLSDEALDKDTKEYFALEKQNLEALCKNIHASAFKGGDSNFCCPEFGSKGLYLGSMDDRKIFSEKLKGLKNAGEVDEIIEFYKELADDWTPDNNRLYKLEYIKKNSQVYT